MLSNPNLEDLFPPLLVPALGISIRCIHEPGDAGRDSLLARQGVSLFFPSSNILTPVIRNQA